MNKKIKVLMIAPISKDLGGTYTTGVCKVAEALMKQKYSNSILFLSSTNISNVKAIRLSNYKNQYNGYRYLIFDIIVLKGKGGAIYEFKRTFKKTIPMVIV